MSHSPHDILGIKRDASDEEIRKAYKRKAKQYHPDVNPEDDAHHKFQLLQQAYALLSDPATRFEYYSQTQNSDPMQVYLEKLEAFKAQLKREAEMKETAFLLRRENFRKSKWFFSGHIALYSLATLLYLISFSLLGSCVLVMYKYHPLLLAIMLPVIASSIWLFKMTGEWFKEYKRYFE
jgi:curved DNA-binding protein CbpA